MTDLVVRMKTICDRYGAPFTETKMNEIAGVADNLGRGLLPLNGLRHARGESSGWFLWAGEERLDTADFFRPVHVLHLVERCPEVLPMLGLGEGWRFLVAPDVEDVWYDESLLDHEA